jgi:hypothetical protein
MANIFQVRTDPPPQVVSKSAFEKTARGIRFTVHNVKPLTTARLPEAPARQAFTKLIESPVEACSYDDDDDDANDKFLTKYEEAKIPRPGDPPLFKTHPELFHFHHDDKHPLIISVLTAYAGHRPLIISPDAVWITIAQGLAQHINLNPEKFREHLAQHKQGKRTLSVGIIDPMKPDWPSVVECFCQQLSKDQKGNRLAKWALPTFTTTGPVERTAFQVVLMDMLKAYHNYVVYCVCGIPSIELLGTPDDWRQIESRLGILDEFGMGWWRAALKPILHQFVEASRGNIDLDHWSNIIISAHTYGTGLLDGWIVELIPYLVDSSSNQTTPTRNPLVKYPWPKVFAYGAGLFVWVVKLLLYLVDCLSNQATTTLIDLVMEPRRGIMPSSLPKGISQVPFLLHDTNRTGESSGSSKELIAGFAGIQQTEDGALKARLGWAVRSGSVLSMALDELERRNLLEAPGLPIDQTYDSGAMAAEVFEIYQRCNGARLCTKSGITCGHLFPLEDHLWTKFIKMDKTGEEAFFRTLHRTDWNAKEKARFANNESRAPIEFPTRHPVLGYVAWSCIGQVDGKLIAIQVVDRKGEHNRIFMFDKDDLEKDPNAYTECTDGVASLILDVLNRP